MRANESAPLGGAPDAAVAAYPNATAPLGYSDDLWNLCMDWWTRGYTEGIDHGRQREHDEVAAIQRAAVRIVRLNATIPPRDKAEDLARRARIDARFNGRRPA